MSFLLKMEVDGTKISKYISVTKFSIMFYEVYTSVRSSHFVPVSGSLLLYSLRYHGNVLFIIYQNSYNNYLRHIKRIIGLSVSVCPSEVQNPFQILTLTEFIIHGKHHVAISARTRSLLSCRFIYEVTFTTKDPSALRILFRKTPTKILCRRLD